MVPRDPHTFLAFWTHSRAALDQWKSVTGPGEWTWRLRGPSESGPVVATGPLPSDAGFQFVPVALAGVTHVFEIGVVHPDGGWSLFAVSQPVATPSGRRPADSHPSAAGAATPVFPWKAPSHTGVSSGPATPPSGGVPGPAMERFIPVSEEILEEVLYGGPGMRTASGSSEQPLESTVPGTTQRRLRRIPGGAVGGGGLEDVGSESDAGVLEEEAGSSEALIAGTPKRRGFWFRVNAEVVLHGSTEPDARLTIAGRPVALRPDGSFTFRFSLPDGGFELPVVAVAAHGDDFRAATVEFHRRTRPIGEVGVHPIDLALRPPVPAAIGPG